MITRAHYLFQHLVTRSVIGSVKNAPSSESNETSFRPVVETVNCTIAHLLSFLADDTTYPFITSDLVNLLVDCSVVIEGGLLPVQLVILPETTRHCRLKKECTLDIQSLEQMFLLQASVFVILRTFLLDLRSKRLGAQSSTFSESTSRDAATVPSGSVDLTLPPDLINNETFSLLLSAIRQVLLFNNCTSILFPFWTHRKLAATLMLKQILQDWQRCHVQSTTMVETSILLVRATKAYLASKTEEPSDYATELAILLRQTFLEPPRVQGTFSLEQTFWIVRSPTISTLLDCLKHISQRPKNRRDVLDAIVLRVLHTMMYPVNDRREDRHLVSMAASYCVSHGLFRTLFSLLSDPKLSNCVVGLLGALLHGVDGSHEMELSCRKTLARLTDDSRARADTDGSSTRTVEVPQRKQPSVPPQKDIRAPIEPLVLSPPKQSPRHTSSSARLRSNQQTENIGLSSMWYEDLQVVLHDTLQASRRLVGSFKSEKMRGTEHENSTLVDDAALTVGGLKLIAHSIHKERRLGKTETDDLSGLFGVAAILSTNLKSCCDVLAQSVATGISDSDFSITQFLVSCGLYLHFAVDSFSEQMVESDNEEKSLQYTLDAFACLGTRLAVTKIPLSTQKIFSCRPSLCHCPNFAKAMTCFMTSFYQNEKPTLDTSCGLKFPLCPCSFFPEILNRGNCKQEKRGLFPFDRVLSVIDCLPFQMRCCLLASLHPPSQDLYCPLPAIPTQTGIYSIDSLFAFVNGNLTSFSDDDDDGRLFATSALSLAQVLLSSLASPSIKIDIGSFLQENGAIGRGKDASSESRSSSLVTLFLKTIMLPLAKTFDPQDEVFSQSLLLSVVRLQAYSTKLYCDGSSFNIRHDATRVFESVFGELGIAPFNGKFTSHDEEVHALLRDVAYSVAGKIQQSHKNPAVRILRWLCLAGVVMVCPSQELRQQFSKVNKGTKEVQTGDRNGAESELRSWMSWLLMTPFSDPDSMVREYTSRKINEVILAENFNLLLSLFSSKEDFQCFSIHMRSTQRTQVDSQCTHELLHASDRIVSDFFREIDRLLHDSCCFVDSQLSLTMAKSHEEVSEKNQAGREDRISIQRSVVRILASICRDADLDLPLHKCLFEKSFIRLIRIWAATPVFNVVEASFPDILSTSSSKALVYGELANLSKCRPLGHLVTKKLSETFIAEAFGDVLILSATKSRDTQFRRLETFIQLLVVGMEETLPRKHTIQECVRFFQESLPAIITQLIVDKDMERLRLTAGFREFLDDRNKDAKAAQDNNPDVVGGSNAQRRHRFPSLTSSDQDLAKKIRNLCLEPKLIEKILPLILINTDRLGMVFFTRDVLKGSGLDLHEIITNREQLIIKNLVWELGRDPDREGLVVRAIRTAAVSRLNQSGARQENRVASPETTEISATTQWVTSHFMYLLVNVIQFKWKTRTAGERLHSLRCLHIILDFLQPAESAQYFPQIMATVNMAITNDEDSGDEEKNSYDSGCSRLYAVKALSKFVRLVALHQLETITLNLTTIVVSLIPVLEDGKVVREFPEHWAIQESREAAVSLLEYLTTGNIGRSLAESFKEIPFLPSSPALENVNRALRSNGVDFDNLLVLSNGTQHRRESFTIEESLTLTSRASSSASKNASGKLVALQKRLAMICTLLDNEITSVRRVALQHLIDILRANRDLFHALIANEGTASMKLYLTAIFRESNTAQQSSADCGCKSQIRIRVISRSRCSLSFPPSGLARGAVTEMMEKLLTRCVHEADSHTRILLATCLGEVGAIGEHRLGDLKIGNSIGDDSLDSASGSYRWQLDQPPWQSQAAKYELQLLTKHLAAAIKAAPSSTDQHKVAFTIQQLLRLLDKSARQSEVGTVTGSDPNGREISKWLKDKLNEAGVYEVIEPFWSSEFKEKVRSFFFDLVCCIGSISNYTLVHRMSAMFQGSHHSSRFLQIITHGFLIFVGG